MKTIYKYKVPLDSLGGECGNFKVSLPARHTALCMKWQKDSLYIWLAVDTADEMVETSFHIVGTGHPLPACQEDYTLYYIGTTLTGAFVWHLFEEKELYFPSDDKVVRSY